MWVLTGYKMMLCYQQTAKSRSGCADTQALWVFAVLIWRRDISQAAAHFFQQTAVQIRLRGCAGSYGYSLFSCGVWISLTLRLIFFSRQQSPDQTARMRRLIWVFTLFSCGVGTSFMMRRIFVFLSSSFFFFFFVSVWWYDEMVRKHSILSRFWHAKQSWIVRPGFLFLMKTANWNRNTG